MLTAIDLKKNCSYVVIRLNWIWNDTITGRMSLNTKVLTSINSADIRSRDHVPIQPYM